MPALILTMPGLPAGQGDHPSARLITEAGDEYTFRYAPVETERNPGGAAWVSTDRPGRAPLLQKSGRTLAELTFTVLIVDLDPQVDVEEDLAALNRIYRSGARVRLDMGSDGADDVTPTWCRLTALTRRALARAHGTNRITSAEVDFTLTEANDVDHVNRIGPTGGGADFTGRIATYRARYRDGKPRTYTVRRGDSLVSISIDFYGNATFWRQIADANGITNPRNLRVGRTLRIP